MTDQAPTTPEETPHRLEGRFEVEAKPCGSLSEAAAVSMAVSLKRIADALEGGRSDRLTIFELIADRMPSHG